MKPGKRISKLSFRHIVRSIPFFGPLLQKKYRQYLLPDSKASSLLKKEFGNDKNIMVVQVGSNDGKSGDPVYSLLKKNPGWKGLFIEPVPFLFERLKKNYSSNPNYLFENVAIGLEKEQKDFFYVDADAKSYLPELPQWFDQLGSFNKDHIIKHFGNKINAHINCIKTRVVPLASLLDENDVKDIDILHIDTEGYDWIVLQQLDLNRYLPRIILFEHKHMADGEKEKAVNFLKSRYKIINMGSDFYCKKFV